MFNKWGVLYFNRQVDVFFYIRVTVNSYEADYKFVNDIPNLLYIWRDKECPSLPGKHIYMHLPLPNFPWNIILFWLIHALGKYKNAGEYVHIELYAWIHR